MSDFTFPDIFQNKLRLEIVSYLISGKKSFMEIKKLTNASDGNISVQIGKLKEENIINVKKSFENNKPKTTYSITQHGLTTFKEYVVMLEKILNSYK